VLSIDAVPAVCNTFWPDARSARAAPRGDIELVFCNDCGMLRNRGFDPDVVTYGLEYQNSLHFSSTFSDYAQALAARLIHKHDLRDKTVLEVGAGSGEFLALLCTAGNNRGIGYDPSYRAESDAQGSGAQVQFVRELLPASGVPFEFDFVVCRHVLEHQANPRGFLKQLKAHAVERRYSLYVEVPDAAYMLKNLAIWDVIYEHPLYFSEGPLARLFHDSGFGVLGTGTAFGGQYLFIEAELPRSRRSRRGGDDGHAELKAFAERFGKDFRARVEAWRWRLDDLTRRGGRVALWGAGSKGTTFLNVVPGTEGIDLVVDVNVRKQGLYVPGIGKVVVAPEQLPTARPDFVIVLNAMYEGEIRSTLDKLGVAAEVVCD
jgi:SAM-dependent methyltransferase